jgi:hypothetical protein
MNLLLAWYERLNALCIYHTSEHFIFIFFIFYDNMLQSFFFIKVLPKKIIFLKFYTKKKLVFILI